MFAIDINNEEIDAQLSRLISQIEDPTSTFQDIGEYLVASTKERFQEGVGPDGETWEPNKPLVEARKGYNQPLVGETKRLSTEIEYHASATGVEEVSNLIQAAVMQLGAKKGEFGTSKKGTPLPWGDIPARPFFGVSDTDSENIIDIVIERLESSVSS